MSTKLVKTEDYLLLIDEEAKIKEGDIVYRDTGVVFKITNERISYYKEVIPNTVHKIYKCIAHRPRTKEAKELDLPLLPNPISIDFNELEWSDIADEDWKNRGGEGKRANFLYKQGYVHGAYKAVQSKQFSLEDMKEAFNAGGKHIYECEANGKDKKCYCRNDNDCNQRNYLTAEEYVQSLSTQQLPKEFIPEYDTVHTDHAPNGFEKLLKFKINSEGKEEIVGTYKY